VRCLSPTFCAIGVRREVVREDEVQRALVERLALTASEARLATRVHEGLSNRAIAEALQAPEGTIKWRVYSLYRRLGVSSRTSMIVALDEVLGTARESERRPIPDSSRAREEATRTPTRATIDALRLYLEAPPNGLAVVDSAGTVTWANSAARALICAEQEDRRAREAILAIVAELRAEERSTAAIDVTSDAGRLRGTVFRADEELCGVHLRRHAPRAADVALSLAVQLGLSAQEALIAVHIARGLTNLEIADELGIREGSVRATSAAIYEKVHTVNRAELTAIVGQMDQE
jgi:DNA-binding NarL/FixJ family response regulator